MFNRKMSLFNFIAMSALIAVGSVLFFTPELIAQTHKAVQKSLVKDSQSPVGYWQSVDIVDNVDDFIPEQRVYQDSIYIAAISFYENGNTSLSMTWNNGFIFLTYHGKTFSSQYFIKSVSDTSYLFFPWVISMVYGHNPSYYVLKKISDSPEDGPPEVIVAVDDSVSEFSDVRWRDLSKFDFSGRPGLIETLIFNENTVWPDNSKLPSGIDPRKILTDAMNPGLGIRDLHKQGITGKGVNVAIIDYPILTDHPEFANQIAAYHEVGCESSSSMHGPAVMSLLAGSNCGTAPEAKVYYLAVREGSKDAIYVSQALEWIIEQNDKLSSSEKIRVVSVSSAPSGPGSPYTKNQEMWDEVCAKAEAKNIMVLDCTIHRGIIGRCFSESDDPEDITKYKCGTPGYINNNLIPNYIMVPSSLRTAAEEYDKGECSYTYYGNGGLSWSIPYCAGVLALGWQLRPELTSVQMKEILFQSAYINNDGNKIINPSEFIKMVKAYGPAGAKDNKTGQFNLDAPYPNPFNPSTTISYQIPEKTNVNLTVYNIMGQSLNTLVDRVENEGVHSIVWDGTDSTGAQLASGIYLYRLKAGDFLKTQKMTFIR